MLQLILLGILLDFMSTVRNNIYILIFVVTFPKSLNFHIVNCQKIFVVLVNVIRFEYLALVFAEFTFVPQFFYLRSHFFHVLAYVLTAFLLAALDFILQLSSKNKSSHSKRIFQGLR